MSEQTSLISLPYIMPSQAQKHVTHKEALRILDAVLPIRVAGPATDTPPKDPQERHLGPGAWVRAVVIGVAASAFTWLVFDKLFLVRLP